MRRRYEYPISMNLLPNRHCRRVEKTITLHMKGLNQKLQEIAVILSTDTTHSGHQLGHVVLLSGGWRMESPMGNLNEKTD